MLGDVADPGFGKGNDTIIITEGSLVGVNVNGQAGNDIKGSRRRQWRFDGNALRPGESGNDIILVDERSSVGQDVTAAATTTRSNVAGKSTVSGNVFGGGGIGNDIIRITEGSLIGVGVNSGAGDDFILVGGDSTNGGSVVKDSVDGADARITLLSPARPPSA